MIALTALLLAGAVPTADRMLADTFPQSAPLPYERAEAEELLAHVEPACADVPGPCESEMVAKVGRSLKLLRQVDFSTSRRVADAIRERCRGVAMRTGAFDADSYMDCTIAAARLPRPRQLAIAGITVRGVTMTGFYSIHDGMELSDVELILGAPGELSSRSGDDSIYAWRARNGGHLVVSFQDGAVVGKAQVMLP